MPVERQTWMWIAAMVLVAGVVGVAWSAEPGESGESAEPGSGEMWSPEVPMGSDGPGGPGAGAGGAPGVATLEPVGPDYPAFSAEDAEAVWLDEPLGLVRYTPEGSEEPTVDLVSAKKARPGAPNIDGLYIEGVVFAGLERYALSGKFIMLDQAGDEGYAVIKLEGPAQLPKYFLTEERMKAYLNQEAPGGGRPVWMTYDQRLGQVERAEYLEIYVIGAAMVIGAGIIGLAVLMARLKKKHGTLPVVG